MIDGKMLILGRPGTAGASAWLRTEQHLNVLARNDLAHCPILRPDDDLELAWKAKCLADVVVSSAAGNEWLYDISKDWRRLGKPWVWDMDDDPVNISPYNPAYAVYGLEEVKFEEPINGREYLWRDGEDGFDLKRNRDRHDAWMEMIGSMTAITTTTEYLGRKLEKLFPDVPILIRPNVLDFNEIWKERRKPSKDGHVRVLYQGGSSHYNDLVSVLPALAELARLYPHVRFLFIGDTKAHASKMIPEDQIEEFDWTPDYDVFALRMARLSPDIAIAPLAMDEQHAEFNRCKSSLKWLDAAGLGVPCVCQWDTPYEEVVNFKAGGEEHWTGVLASTPDEWLYALSLLVENPDMREHIGTNAFKEAYNNWNAEKMADTYLREYEVILGHHDAHTEA